MKRKFQVASIVLVFAVLLSGSAFAHGQDVGECAPKQMLFGGTGGGQFVAEAPVSIQLRSGSEVDALILNDVKHGGDGGALGKPLILGAGEYINRIIVRHGSRVDKIIITTNKGNGIEGGGSGGTETVLSNIRVLTLGGRSGSRLDQLEVTYCENYQ